MCKQCQCIRMRLLWVIFFLYSIVYNYACAHNGTIEKSAEVEDSEIISKIASPQKLKFSLNCDERSNDIKHA